MNRHSDASNKGNRDLFDEKAGLDAFRQTVQDDKVLEVGQMAWTLLHSGIDGRKIFEIFRTETEKRNLTSFRRPCFFASKTNDQGVLFGHGTAKIIPVFFISPN